MFCARVCAGEGGGGKNTADIEAASCVFFCLQGGQRGGELRGGDVILARRSKVSLVPDMARVTVWNCPSAYSCYCVQMVLHRHSVGVRRRTTPHLGQFRASIRIPRLSLRGHLFHLLDAKPWCLISRYLFSPSLTFPSSVSNPYQQWQVLLDLLLFPCS